MGFWPLGNLKKGFGEGLEKGFGEVIWRGLERGSEKCFGGGLEKVCRHSGIIEPV